MKARIKKGVSPYGGRTFEVMGFEEYPNGRRVVRVSIGKRPVFGTYAADVREYEAHEVELIEGVFPWGSSS